MQRPGLRAGTARGRGCRSLKSRMEKHPRGELVLQEEVTQSSSGQRVPRAPLPSFISPSMVQSQHACCPSATSPTKRKRLMGRG